MEGAMDMQRVIFELGLLYLKTRGLEDAVMDLQRQLEEAKPKAEPSKAEPTPKDSKKPAADKTD